jgi:hypothetical protein
MAARELFEIWEETGLNPFRLQLVNYVAHFPSQGAAERYAEAVKRHRAAQAPPPAVPSKKK